MVGLVGHAMLDGLDTTKQGETLSGIGHNGPQRTRHRGRVAEPMLDTRP